MGRLEKYIQQGKPCMSYQSGIPEENVAGTRTEEQKFGNIGACGRKGNETMAY